MKRHRCLIAMSGGVDSSVAAALMQEQGYECAGVSMQLLFESAQATREHEDAARVCAQLNIPHYKVDLRRDFSFQVVKPFIKAYCEGVTPNPCINCNKHLKFKALINWARKKNFDCLATGHYVRKSKGRLCKAKDVSKDQSYALYTLTSEQVQYLQFPLGNYTKEAVRKLSEALDLKTAHKPESQDICFIPDGDYAGFIETQLSSLGCPTPRPGPILTSDGTVLGSHRGVHHYTIGQRRGLGVYAPEPFFVLDIDAASQTLIVGPRQEQGKQVAFISEVNYFGQALPREESLYLAKHRYRGKEHQVRVFKETDKMSKIVFQEKQRDLTKGQALVLYDGTCVVGGGTIVATA